MLGVSRAMAPLPFVLSPYLRPVLRDGLVMYDNGLNGELVLPSPLEDELVRALWLPVTAEARFQALCEQHGVEPVERALGRLRSTWMLFRSREECEQLYDELLDAGLPDVPFVDQIELTNRCPMRCGFCPRGIPGRLTRPRGVMALELYTELLGQLHPAQASYRPIELHHLGESLGHPDVARFVELATSAGVPTELSVNPSLLEPPLARALLEARIYRLVLSLDGMDDETSQAARGPAASYTSAERNIEALLELARQRRPAPKVVIQMLELHCNRHQRDAFLQRWGRSQLPFVTAYVKPLEGPDPDLGVETSRPAVYLCSYPWRSVVVLWDGRVVPCCRDADAQLVLGDLREQTLRQIWHGERAQALRAALRSRSVRPGALCAECRWSRQRFADALVQRHPDRAAPNPLQW